MSFGVILGRILVRCSTGPSLCPLILAQHDWEARMKINKKEDKGEDDSE